MNGARPADAGGDSGPRHASAQIVPGFHGAFDTLSDPAVRDLAWLLFSADLLRAQPPVAPLAQWWADDKEAGATFDWLVQLDRDPARLHETLAGAPTNRLGRYAEILLGWFLANGPAARLVAQNVALRRAGLTLGECDFLVQSRSGARLHWELAVKCYLYAGADHGARASLAEFVGPDLRDRFDWKLAHLRDHQLRLTTREAFASLGYGGPWLAQMFVKGWLFYRAGKAAPSRMEDVPGLAADHGRGWWVTRSEWPAFAQQQAADGWSVLPRLAWLAPRRLAGGAISAQGGERAAIAFPAPPEAIAPTGPDDTVLVAAFVADGAGGYREASRGFIVPEDWPARAAEFARQ
ncbi:DUF1853 family protein [Paraburkholderia lycopersici]|uniref:DUF1853 domain-containing protein n=1 Tax=Paraburkholderia lycopersici TaxID=416944 RepID=A0A1G6HVE7_9BURK|nr:DUF1853 family protein [Paraburkholderia lycopersici]SDB97446.1 hypothetical protein SAMN05421548_103119 [Paraburkholderia lycopersici]